jgi:hypothetical protein
LGSVAVTGSDGSFTSTALIPEDAGFPANFTVTVSFAGDAVYNGSQATARGNIQALPSQVATAEEPTEEPTEFQSYVVPTDDSTTTTPTSTMSAAGMDGESSRHLMVFEIAFLVVAFVAIAVLLVIGIVSHGTKALLGGERRGFGSDFGKDGTTPVKEIPSL